MIELVKWLLGLQPSSCTDARLAELDSKLQEATEHRSEAREARAQAERIGPEQRWRLNRNHFGEGIKEALHERGWTQG